MTKQQQLEVVIKGPLEKVFDLVNVAALWPHWHPITRAVSGVTDIPFQKGDMIYEHIRTPTNFSGRSLSTTDPTEQR